MSSSKYSTPIKGANTLNTSNSAGEAYFDLEEKQANDLSKSQSESSNVPLTWRGDPSETFSDWTIVIVTNELETMTFHVHKSVICYGTRQSRYFARAVMNHEQQQRNLPHTRTPNKSSNSSPTVKVELDQRDANNFTILLDYMYAPCSYLQVGQQGTMDTATLTSTLTSPSALLLSASSSTDNEEASYMALGEDITSENAVSLRHLARLFQVDSFMMAVNKFIQRDLSFSTGPTYLIRASEYRDERLVESARRLCVENFEQLDRRALISLPLHLFRVVVKSLESFEEENQSLSHFLSEVVCRYLEKHRKEMSAELLLELTDPLIMPYIASEAAIGFTALIKGMDPQQTKAHWDPMVAFCRRCARSVVQVYGWNEFCITAAVDEYLNNCRQVTSGAGGPTATSTPSSKNGKKSSRNNDAVSHVDSLLFSTSFAAALEQAQDDYEEIVQEQERVESVVGALNQTISTLERAHELKDDILTKQQSELEQANAQVRELKQQVADLQRHQQLQQQQLLKQQRQHEHERQQQQQQHQQQVQHQQSMDDEPTLQASSTLSSSLSSGSGSGSRVRSPPPPPPPPPLLPCRQTPPRPTTSTRSPHSARSTVGGGGPTTTTGTPCLGELSPRLYQDPAIRDLISPSSIGTDVHKNKTQKIRELRTKAEMRTRSLLV